MNNQRLSLFLTVLLIALGTTSSTLAHHAFAAHYLEDTEVEIKGTVTEFWFQNPHVRILLDVGNTAGETEGWIAETGARNVFIRRGWTGEELKPGDYVEILGNASRDGSNTMYVQTLLLPNGNKYRTGRGALQLDTSEEDQ